MRPSAIARRSADNTDGLSRLFQEIRVKKTIAELRPEYQRFAEWLRIEVAATLYHVFLAEDNSPELFAQAKRIHSIVPYTVLKNVIRIANPAAVMSGVLDLFLAQPFGARSLMQRMFGMAIHDSIRSVQKAIDSLVANKIRDDALYARIKAFTDADEKVKTHVRYDAAADGVDVVVAILRSDALAPPLSPPQVDSITSAYDAWSSVVEGGPRSRRSSRQSSGGASSERSGEPAEGDWWQGAELFAHLKQLLKLCMRQRDKAMMLEMIEEVSMSRALVKTNR